MPNLAFKRFLMALALLLALGALAAHLTSGPEPTPPTTTPSGAR